MQGGLRALPSVSGVLNYPRHEERTIRYAALRGPLARGRVIVLGPTLLVQAIGAAFPEKAWR